MKLLAPLSELAHLSEIQSSGLKLQSVMELRMQGPLTPNSELGFNVRHLKKFTRIRSLAILSWVIGPIGFLLREDLRTYCLKHFSAEHRLILELALHSITSAEKFCILSFSERDWFGNLIPSLRRELEDLSLRNFKQSPAKHQERVRGYRDHGTLRPSHKWLENFDFSFNEEHARIEREREFFQNSVKSLVEILEGMETSKVNTSLKEMIEEHWKANLEDYLISI